MDVFKVALPACGLPEDKDVLGGSPWLYAPIYFVWRSSSGGSHEVQTALGQAWNGRSLCQVSRASDHALSPPSQPPCCKG